jgi:hypothetical protein
VRSEEVILTGVLLVERVEVIIRRHRLLDGERFHMEAKSSHVSLGFVWRVRLRLRT